MFRAISILCLVVPAILLSACGPSKKTLLEIDNASDQVIKVEIDSWTRTLEPYSSVKDSFFVGSHNVKVSSVDGERILEKEFELEEEYRNALLNISGIQYLTDWQLMSAVGDYSDLKNYTFRHGDLVVPQVRGEMLGTADQIVLHGDWRFGVTDTIPETVEIYGGTTAWVGKVWRMDEYLQVLEAIVLARELAEKEERDRLQKQRDEITDGINAIWEGQEEETEKIMKEMNENIEKILNQ